MKNKLTKDECITAGAWYRIWKDISTEARIKISDNLHLSINEGSKMNNIIDKIDRLETKLGFEAKADVCFPSNADLFYGAIGASIRSATDQEVNDAMYKIILQLLLKLQKNKGDYLDSMNQLTQMKTEILHDEIEAKQKEIDDDLKEGLENLVNHIFKEEE